MSKAAFRKLNVIVAPLITGSDVNPDDADESIMNGYETPRFVKLLLTLKFFACGQYHYNTGGSLGYSAGHVCNVIQETAAAIASLFHQFVQQPTPDDRRRVKHT